MVSALGQWNSGLAVVLACLLLTMPAFTFVALRRLRLLRDHEKIRRAIDQMAGCDFEGPDPRLETTRLKSVESALLRLRPQLQDRISKLEWTAHHDSLTNLLNANSFRAQCEKVMLASPGGICRSGALLYFDVNEFKKINDTLGHHAGDQVLATIGDRLRLAAMSFTDTRLQAFADGTPPCDCEPVVARIGGDEFAMLLPGELSHDQVERFAQRLQRVIGEPCFVGLQTLRIRLSIGIAFWREGEKSFDRLLAAADSAMYSAKSKGGGHYCFFTEKMRTNADRILKKELELRHALTNRQFALHFQPQLNLRTGRIDTAEALIRWNHPTRGLVMPGDFIPFAESHGLIDEIGDWVMTEAVRTAAQWQEQGVRLKVSINVSPKQLQRVELIAMIRANLEHYGVAPSRIEIEITEAAIMRDEGHSFERLEKLRDDGVTVALDDFGTGYSNLSQLMLLPMDRLKLDKSLIDGIANDQRKWTIAIGMIRLARDLGFQVVAEGVELPEQVELLEEAGCDFIQGYLISKPLPQPELLALVDAFQAKSVGRAA
ncbi:putative bifunctional diguanylate cyclase/phosphodiesterase [Novosphingobium beihaiensis]|uniref:Bifunctional diguanylate cyclase/phosphodiesterase n=1 Tax=Novosphingobium beihaiensis TaxID=2930389 RepID=A0ABT0BPN5_9SPHN|nr:bifunctional diguanylate cyclase/phosphodiesterase [Novosphingobium beihaiensis]MCJ2187003.1 bifunctional diguanylate cyclase/phosphodiesterase [Novosphingobium beihaiensis]